MSDTDQAGKAAQPRRSRWIWIALVASLAINLLVLGAVGGSMWVFRHGEHGHGGPAMGSNHIKRFIRSLPKARQADVRRVLGDARRGARPQWREVRQARRAALKELEREPFDRGAYASALTQVHVTERRARAGINKAFVDLAAALTPEERRAFVKWVRDRRGHRRYWRRKFRERGRQRDHDGRPPPPPR
jgi:uncharacterized membrane protein